MKLTASPVLCALLLLSVTGHAQQTEDFEYFEANRQMVRNGVQAVLMCNGLFTSNRTLDQVFDQELAYLSSSRFPGTVGSARGGEYQIETALKAVEVGGEQSGPVVRAAFRQGIGCVVMAPDQTFEDIASLPELTLPPPSGDPASIAWPDGDLAEELAHGADAVGALQVLIDGEGLGELVMDCLETVARVIAASILASPTV